VFFVRLETAGIEQTRRSDRRRKEAPRDRQIGEGAYPEIGQIGEGAYPEIGQNGRGHTQRSGRMEGGIPRDRAADIMQACEEAAKL
jgi:hypothetical protein